MPVGTGVEGLTKLFHLSLARFVSIVMFTLFGSEPLYAPWALYSSAKSPKPWPHSCATVAQPS
jgi:hypothetical protein